MRPEDSGPAIVIGAALIGMAIMLLMVVLAPLVVRAFQ